MLQEGPGICPGDGICQTGCNAMPWLFRSTIVWLLYKERLYINADETVAHISLLPLLGNYLYIDVSTSVWCKVRPGGHQCMVHVCDAWGG